MALQQIVLYPNLWISLLTSPADSDTVISYHKQPAMIDFGFLLNGRLNHRLQGDLTDDLIEADSGIACIGFFTDRHGLSVEGKDGSGSESCCP